MKANTIKILFMLIIIPATTWAGDNNEENRYQIGGRSAIISGTMQLSDINPAFDDLSGDGFKGVHHSGLFFLYRVKPWLRAGMETLVGNADENEKTTMDFQAAGPVIDLSYGKKVFVAGGLHFGAMIANTMTRTDEAAENKVQNGTYFKSSGIFFAPYISAGIRFQKYEIGLFYKDISVHSAEEQVKINAFNAAYFGISYSFRF